MNFITAKTALEKLDRTMKLLTGAAKGMQVSSFEYQIISIARAQLQELAEDIKKDSV